jgi:hypothetical protein
MYHPTSTSRVPPGKSIQAVEVRDGVSQMGHRKDRTVGDVVTPDGFFISVDSRGCVTLNCSVTDPACDWWKCWENENPSLWKLHETARKHLLEVHYD